MYVARTVPGSCSKIFHGVSDEYKGVNVVKARWKGVNMRKHRP